MAIQINDNIYVRAGKPIDFKFGPFSSIQEANSTIPIEERYSGLIFGVYSQPLDIPNSNIIYYYYWNDLSDTSILELRSIVFNGTSEQFLKGDGSLDSNLYAYLDGNGKIPSELLPSYVDDVLEFPNFASFPVSGSTGIIYIALDTNRTYRWSGSIYVEISPSDVTEVFGRVGSISAEENDYLLYYPRLSQSYDNPSWINSLNWSKITDTPTTLSGYSITDAYTQEEINDFFSGTTFISGYNKTNWDLAYSNRIDNLTTIGNSGSASLSGNTLNIPTYTLSGLGVSITNGQIAFGGSNNTITGSNDLFWDSSNGRLGIGNNAPTNPLTLGVIPASSLQLASATFYSTINNNSNTFSLVTSTDSVEQRPTFMGVRTRGTLTSPTTVQNGDWLANFLSAGFDGSALQFGAGLLFRVESSPSSGSVPQLFSIFTGSSSATRTEKLQVRSNGNVIIQNGGTFTDAGFRLDVNGSARVQGALTVTGGITVNQNAVAMRISGGTNILEIISNDSLRVNGVFSATNGITSTNGFYNGINLGINAGSQFNFSGIGNSPANAVRNHIGIINSGINPQSGGIVNMINISPTGTATSNGSIRSIFIDGNPTLSTGYYRAIETTRGDVLFGTTSGSVGIGANTSINASAILDITSTTKGFLPPRMTSTQRDAIVTPATGLTVYNTTNNTNDYYNGSAWISQVPSSRTLTINGTAFDLSTDRSWTIPSDNIYNSDGTLTGNRTLTSGGFNLTFTGSNTASSGTARGLNLTHTLVASANNDVLVGLDINPTFTNGAFTGVRNFALRTPTNSTSSIGTLLIGTTSNPYSLGMLVVEHPASYASWFKRGNNMIEINPSSGGVNIITSTLDVGGSFLPLSLSARKTNADFYLQTNGNIGIGTTTDAGFRLDVNGTARVQGALTTTVDATINTIRVGLGAGSVSTNLAVGALALNSNVSGVSNVAIGNEAARNLTASNVTAVGYLAGTASTTGGAWTAVGVRAGAGSTTGTNWVAVGATAGRFSNGTAWVAVGSESALSNTSGSNWIAIGYRAGYSNLVNGRWIAIGQSSAYSATGNSYTAIGDDSANNNTTGDSWVTLGRDSARFIADGVTTATSFSNSIYIGNQTRVGVNGATNETVIGYQAIGLGSNTTVIGNSSTTFGRWWGNLLIGTSTNVVSSALTVDSTTKGFLPPRMTSAQRDAIVSPATGLQLYQTDSTEGQYLNLSSGWQRLLTTADIGTTITADNLYNSNGSLTANRTVNLNNFNLDFSGSTISRFFSNGNLGIGTTTDNGFKLDVSGTTRISGTLEVDTVNNGIGDFLTRDTNGVITRRTAAELVTDISGITGTIASGQVAYGTGADTIGGSSTFTFSPTSQLLLNNSVTASSGVARGANYTPTLVASANNNVLVGLDINPTFTNGAFTGVSNFGLRTNSIIELTNISGSSPRLNFRTTSGASYIYAQEITSNRRIVISAGNSDSFYFNQDGRLEIGTLQTSGAVNVATSSAGTINVGQASSSLTLNRNSTSNTARLQFATSGSNNWLLGIDGNVSNSGFSISDGFTYPFIISNSFIVNINSTRFFNSTSNVSIGSATDAGFRLDVNGTARVQSGIAIGSGTVDATRLFDLIVSSSSDILHRFWNIGTGGAKMRFVSDGTSVSQHQWTTTNYWLAAIACNNTFGMDFRVGLNTTEAALDSSSRMRILPNGNVLIGSTTDAGFRLDVNGTARVQGATTINGNLTVDTNTLFVDSTNDRVGIGTTSPATPLQIGVSPTTSLLATGVRFLSSSESSGNSFNLTTASSVLVVDRPVFQGVRSRGTLSSPLAVQSGDFITSFLSGAYDGSAIQFSAGLFFDAESNATLGNAPQQINLVTGTTGANRTTKLQVRNNGNVIIQNGGTFTDAGFRLDVNGTARVQGNTTITGNIISGGNISVGQNNRIFFAESSSWGYLGQAFGWYYQGSSNFPFKFSNSSLMIGFSYITNGTWGEGNLYVNNNILVGTTSIDSSAVVNITSTTKGFLPPRMTSAQRDLIATPATGLTVYNTTNNLISLYNGTNWQDLISPNSNGNILLGTSTDNGNRLQVNGNATITKALLSNQENLDVDSGATRVIATISASTYTAAFFDYVIANGSNLRTGTVYAVHDGTNIEFTETSTADLGSTTAVTLSVDLSDGNIRLLATTTTDNWTIKTLIRGL